MEGKVDLNIGNKINVALMVKAVEIATQNREAQMAESPTRVSTRILDVKA